jgi:hypothetical protein
MAEQDEVKATESKIRAREEFITNWPLYSPAPIENFLPPQRVSFYCPSAFKKETTWAKVGDSHSDGIDGISGSTFHWVWYICLLCNAQYLQVSYRLTDFEERTKRVAQASGLRVPPPPPITERVSTKVVKIGQYPPQSIEIPKALRKSLGESAGGFYRKALLNRNQGFGLGAISYVRRVVEDKTDELIEAAAQVAESHKINAETVEQIRNAKTAKMPYEDKLKLASLVLPDVLLIDGINPLGALFDLVSKGIHELSEEDCLAIADETREVFEMTLSDLKAQVEARQGFAEKVKKLTRWKSPASSDTSVE